jgi:L-fuculose-phosphate aldolase
VDATIARQEVHEACERMVADGLVVGSAGNISLRLDEHHAVVTAAGVPYGLLGPDDHPVVDLRDGSWEGRRRPTSELALHVAILRAMPEVRTVVHTHSVHAAGFAVARVPLEFVCNENLGPGCERVLVTEPYAAPGSSGLADAAVRTLRRQPGARACLLANHGPVAVGADLETAELVVRQVEWIAQVVHVAATAGRVHVLDRAEQDAVGSAYGIEIGRER